MMQSFIKSLDWTILDQHGSVLFILDKDYLIIIIKL